MDYNYVLLSDLMRLISFTTVLTMCQCEELCILLAVVICLVK